MGKELPRIGAVTVEGPSTLRIRWQGRRATDVVNLSGWIATGGELLAPLCDAAMFSRAAVVNYGAAVGWDGDELAIDALHLKKLAEEQRPFNNHDVRDWQKAVKLSNNEAADLLGISVSTWNAYKVDAAIPQPVAIVLRAALRDPLVMQAHLRRRIAGRPRKAGAEHSKRSA